MSRTRGGRRHRRPTAAQRAAAALEEARGQCSRCASYDCALLAEEGDDGRYHAVCLDAKACERRCQRRELAASVCARCGSRSDELDVVEEGGMPVARCVKREACIRRVRAQVTAEAAA